MAGAPRQAMQQSSRSRSMSRTLTCEPSLPILALAEQVRDDHVPGQIVMVNDRGKAPR